MGWSEARRQGSEAGIDQLVGKGVLCAADETRRRRQGKLGYAGRLGQGAIRSCSCENRGREVDVQRACA